MVYKIIGASFYTNDKCKVYIINDPIEFLNIDITVLKRAMKMIQCKYIPVMLKLF